MPDPQNPIPPGAPAAPPAAPAAPADPPKLDTPEAVDKYVAERKEKKRTERGGVHVRIDKLTKENAELARKAATAPPAPATPPAAAAPAAAVPPAAPAPAPAAAPPAAPAEDPRPKREDFQNETDFTAKMAEWVVRQQNNITPRAPAAPATPAAAPAIDPARKAELDNFITATTKFVERHPDFNQALQAAASRGLDISPQAVAAIQQMAAPEVVYWLAQPANELEARRLMSMPAVAQIAHVGRIAERLRIGNPADFVSSAPPPGQRLTGTGYTGTDTMSELAQRDPDEYIRRRKLNRRAR